MADTFCACSNRPGCIWSSRNELIIIAVIMSGKSRTFKKRVIMTTEETILKKSRVVASEALRLFGVDLSNLEVCFNLRGIAAGQIHTAANLLRYNLPMAERQLDAFLKTTIPHEIAHAVCQKLYGRRVRPHGPEWQRICVALGGDGKRCHSFTSARTRRVHRLPYRCSCRSWDLTVIRVNRIQRGVRYHCRKCGESLQAMPTASG
jgi:SprT protein